MQQAQITQVEQGQRQMRGDSRRAPAQVERRQSGVKKHLPLPIIRLKNSDVPPIRRSTFCTDSGY